MKYVCINSSNQCVEAAAADGERRVYERDTSYVQASRALMPMLDGVLDKVGFKAAEADFIAVVVGPGSFTGIRIGVSAARAMGYSLKKPVVSINSNELAAYNSMRGAGGTAYESVLSALDAGNALAYVAVYGDSVDEVLFPPRCMTLQELVAFRNEIDEPCRIAADEKLAACLHAAPTSGDGILDLALQRFLKTGGCAFSEVEPLYIRRPQAEESLAQAEKGGAKEPSGKEQ